MKIKELIEKLQQFDGELLVATTMDSMVESAAPVEGVSTHQLAFDPSSEGDWLISHGDDVNDADFIDCVVIY